MSSPDLRNLSQAQLGNLNALIQRDACLSDLVDRLGKQKNTGSPQQRLVPYIVA